MCAYKTLHYNENGYVVKCHQCRHLQIAFGNITVCQTEKEFQSFRSSVSRFCSQHENHRGCPDFKHITIATPSAKVKLLVSAKEIMELNDLLQQAALALEIEKLLAFGDGQPLSWLRWAVAGGYARAPALPGVMALPISLVSI